MRQKLVQKDTVITAVSWFILLGILAGGVYWLSTVKQSGIKQYDAIILRSAQAATSEVSRYKFIRLPGTNASFLVEPRYKYTNQADVWALVNKTHSIELAYMPKMLEPVPIPTYNNEQLLVRPELIEPLRQLYAAAESEGVYLMVRSAYRSSQDQAAVTKEVDQGLAALPGQSEHQTGLAVDFNNQPVACSNYCYLSDVNATWLANNAYKYGFVLRYTPGKESITGYPAEAWHYRYVGERLAKALHDTGLSYEELYDLFAQARPRL